jgi:hypothetical protein
MTKLGGPYEIALYEILRLIDPDFEIEQGVWVDGPDGSREVDVLVTGSFRGASIKFLFECKDYSGKRRMGIGIIDAFDSKLRDLEAFGGVICSNADFSEPARTKAKRLGIGLMAIVKENAGASFEVYDLYERREVQGSVENGKISVSLEKPQELPGGFFDSPRIGSNSIVQLAAQIHYWGVIVHPIVNGRPVFRYKFLEPLAVGLESNGITEIIVTGDISGVWLRNKVKIATEEGLYNWLSRSVLPTSAAAKITWHDAIFDDPKYWVEEPKVAASLPDLSGFALFSCVGVYGFSEWAEGDRIVSVRPDCSAAHRE